MKNNSNPIIFSPELEKSFKNKDKQELLKSIWENRNKFTTDVFNKFIRKINTTWYLFILWVFTTTIISMINNVKIILDSNALLHCIACLWKDRIIIDISFILPLIAVICLLLLIFAFPTFLRKINGTKR